ncbi:MAG: transposase [Bacteroidales bacterium]|nr:transposase [Bacteroidales bacterium]
MPRLSRKISPTGVYHVMLRGLNRDAIFADEDDCRKFEKILRELTNPKDNNNQPLPPYCEIHAYCLMRNHIHLLMAEGVEPLSNTMKRLGVAYVSYYNKRHSRLGPLFHDRFRSEPVTDSKYFVTLLRYIHCNPVEAGIVELPGQYQWSSYHEYDGSIKSNCICSRRLPFSSIEWKDVCEMVLKVSEVSRPKSSIAARRLTDEEAIAIVRRICGKDAFEELDQERRNLVLRAAVKAGVSKRQLSRIAKVDYKTVFRIVGKSV